MAKSKDDLKYATAQAKLSDDEALRVRYKAGTPLEGGKIADSEPVDLFSSALNISDSKDQQSQSSANDYSGIQQPQLQRHVDTNAGRKAAYRA